MVKEPQKRWKEEGREEAAKEMEGERWKIWIISKVGVGSCFFNWVKFERTGSFGL